MKNFTFATASIALTTSQVTAQLNLPNYQLLNSNQELSPFESIAFIYEFDEIPIYGGKELREKMLAKANNAK